MHSVSRFLFVFGVILSLTNSSACKKQDENEGTPQINGEGQSLLDEQQGQLGFTDEELESVELKVFSVGAPYGLVAASPDAFVFSEREESSNEGLQLSGLKVEVPRGLVDDLPVGKVDIPGSRDIEAGRVKEIEASLKRRDIEGPRLNIEPSKDFVVGAKNFPVDPDVPALDPLKGKKGVIKGLMIQMGWVKDLVVKRMNFIRKHTKNLRKTLDNPDFAFTKIVIPEKVEGHGDIVLGVLPDTDVLTRAKAELGDGRNLSVLAVVEDFELTQRFEWAKKAKKGEPVPDAMTFNAYKGEDVDGDWAQIVTPDYQPVKGDLIDRGADFIHSQLLKGNDIYVHCKSGKGRSATMVAAYLIKYKKMEPLEAINLILSQRKQVSIGKKGLFGIPALGGGHRRALIQYSKSLSR